MKKLSEQEIQYIESLIEKIQLDDLVRIYKHKDTIITFTIIKNGYGQYMLTGSFLGYVYMVDGKSFEPLFDKYFSFFANKHNLKIGKAKYTLWGSFECPIFGMASERVAPKPTTKPATHLAKKTLEQNIIAQKWVASKFDGGIIYTSPSDKHLKLRLVKDEKLGGWLFQFFVLSSSGQWYKGINKRANSGNRILKILNEMTVDQIYDKGSY